MQFVHREHSKCTHSGSLHLQLTLLHSPQQNLAKISWAYISQCYHLTLHFRFSYPQLAVCRLSLSSFYIIKSPKAHHAQCGRSVEEEVLCQLARRFQPGVARMASRLYRLHTGLHLDHTSAYIEDYIPYAHKYSRGQNFRGLQILHNKIIRGVYYRG